jgi:hypothetical protein
MATATETTVPKTPAENEPWLAFWASRPLPVLESTKAALAQFAGQAEHVHVGEVVDLILRDPLLTAHALRLVNLRERGALAADVVSIDSVVMLLGVEAAIRQFSRLPTVESLLLPHAAPAYFAVLKEVATARFAARLAREFAVLRYDARLDEIYVTALLANLPRLLHALGSGLKPVAPPVALASAALPLFARWHLPDVFSLLLDDHASATQRAMLQQTVLRLAERLQLGWWQDGVADDLALAASTLGVPAGELWQMVCRNLLYFARRNWPYAQIFPPARWLPMMPGEWPRPAAKSAPTAAPASADDASKPGLQDILRELQRASHVGASFNQLMALSIRALSEGVGLQRIAFGLLLAGQNALKTRYAVGYEANDPMRTLAIELATPHLMTKLMLKPQSIWLNRSNRARFESLLPRALRGAIGQRDFFAMSLFVEDKPVGLFIAEAGKLPLDEAQYNAFKQVCLLTGQCLTAQAQRLRLGSA